MDPTPASAPVPSITRRLMPRILFVAWTLFCLTLPLAVLQFQEHRSRQDAFTALQQAGFDQTVISARDGLSLRYTNPEFTDRDLEPVLSHMETLRRRHDFGLSKGLPIKLIDFGDSQVAQQVVTRLQAVLPATEIRSRSSNNL